MKKFKIIEMWVILRNRTLLRKLLRPQWKNRVSYT